MADKSRLFTQTPEVIKDSSGLVKTLTDIHGNRFNADDYKPGFEIIIDYPNLDGRNPRVIDYVARIDASKRKYWHENRRRQWIRDLKLDYCGKWVSGWD